MVKCIYQRLKKPPLVQTEVFCGVGISSDSFILQIQYLLQFFHRQHLPHGYDFLINNQRWRGHDPITDDLFLCFYIYD